MVKNCAPKSKINMKVAEIAKKIMQQENISVIWYGNHGLCQDIATMYWGEKESNNHHPINAISMVLSNVSKSDLFFKSGHIEHLDRLYPCFEIL